MFSPSMVNLIFGAESVIVSPVEMHLAEYVVAIQRTSSNSWMWLVLNLNQNCEKIHRVINSLRFVNPCRKLFPAVKFKTLALYYKGRANYRGLHLFMHTPSEDTGVIFTLLYWFIYVGISIKIKYDRDCYKRSFVKLS